MRHQALQHVCLTCRHQARAASTLSRASKRYVQISATPTSTEPTQRSIEASQTAAPPDARFEVLGTHSSLLSASLSASQNLYTRKGTLVGFNGIPENALSTLSLLEPFRRGPLAIPFLYQRLTSTTPYTALLAPKSPNTSLVVVHLDGRVDWILAQRNALQSWTGPSLSLRPQLNTALSPAHWGQTHTTGRGLLALTGRGLIHQISLKQGEEYIVHPSHVVAYTAGPSPPRPYRFKATSFRLQIPALFLHFTGPTQILLQSRGNSLRDSLSNRDVNEIADSPAGSAAAAFHRKPPVAKGSGGGDVVHDAVTPGPGVPSEKARETKLSFATVGQKGEGVRWEKDGPQDVGKST
ncbi:hypothetical protein KC367_g8426 [Hortaea werneckii]|nr:hypothetical protein KC358_g17970 [Hortaea werneckii]KAI6819837.1 hypothetical protein KC350_g9971 [Hortaea werneckii]KAI6918309.1 hypothetical protein KC341_g17966 [Hortaea werneckii]KAI6926423.1 hypothetical protein KC348_g8678 [Hortaea werneckii]KAI6950292.1 hypothetical protein KC321_g18387 [Hortaea werneckii]